jgi:outer membrane protein assembly factor BamB
MLTFRRGTLLLFAAFLATLSPGAEPAADRAPTNKGLPESVALPRALWSRYLMHSHLVTGDTTRWLRSVEMELRRASEPALPPFAPVAVTRPAFPDRSDETGPIDLLVYRSHWGVHAVQMKSGELDWESPAKWGMDEPRLGVYRGLDVIRQWILSTVTQKVLTTLRPAAVIENSAVGRLCADRTQIYSIDDLAALPAYDANAARTIFGRQLDSLGQHLELADAVRHNRLHAFDFASGKLKYELGDTFRHDAFTDCLFRGPPVAIDEKDYVLVLRKTEPGLAARLANPLLAMAPLKECFWRTELICLDPKSLDSPVWRRPFLWRAELKYPIWQRLRAAQIVSGGDALVCPTDRGVVIGVDRRTGDLRWEYRYTEDDEREKSLQHSTHVIEDVWWSLSPPLPGPEFRLYPWWRDSSPAISGERLVFTPSFSRFVHCINTRDGTLLWQSAREEDDLYLGGVVGDTVLIIGKNSVRGLNLVTGKRVWQTPTGMPCGYGAAREGTYYLPLESSAIAGKRAEIWAIDPTAGHVVARFRADAAHPPGNLFFFGQHMVSQSLHEIGVYPLPVVRGVR